MSEISGYEDIKKKKNIIHSEKVENELKPMKRWILETDGTNLIDILPKDYIDSTKTTSKSDSKTEFLTLTFEFLTFKRNHALFMSPG